MPRYYFHQHLNGQLTEDRRGTLLRTAGEACSSALRSTIGRLRNAIQGAPDNYLAIEVTDGDRTLYVVRAKTSVERR
jgi:hypothetical protein